jgi:hypothetical protein
MAHQLLFVFEFKSERLHIDANISQLKVLLHTLKSINPNINISNKLIEKVSKYDSYQ